MMKRFMVSFYEGDMKFPQEDLPAVAEASHEVVREAKAAGVWIFGGGLLDSDQGSMVAEDRTITDAPHSGVGLYLGGFSIIEVDTREQALEWAHKIAVSCRCAQEVRELMYDPES